eukprot:TRINITY_DN663_c0_g2_i1.p1 TRINITY_DN663_c0_g2~~TRINITY_DN663_c0_g2_i1.p1  ORF type:complete len:476 (-),score=50.37 TRINITY_DN663_c0_g2_i1:26-1453(-)
MDDDIIHSRIKANLVSSIATVYIVVHIMTRYTSVVVWCVVSIFILSSTSDSNPGTAYAKDIPDTDVPTIVVDEETPQLAQQLGIKKGRIAIQDDIAQESIYMDPRDNPLADEGDQVPPGGHRFTVFLTGGNNTKDHARYTGYIAPDETVDLDELLKELDMKLRSPRERRKRRPATEASWRRRLFTNDGDLVVRARQLRSHDIFVFVRNDEHFIWPGMYVGFKRKLIGVKPPPGRQEPLVMETLALEPRVFLIRDFLAPQEADYLMSIASPNLEKSRLANFTEDKSENYNDIRTSSQTWLDDAGLMQSRFTRTLPHRLQDLTHLTLDHSESIQVVHYTPYQHYHAHYDYFQEDAYGVMPDLERGRRNRMITVLYYLNHVEEGGGTCFPRADQHEETWDWDYAACKGVVTTPRKGDAVMFYSLEADGHTEGVKDLRSLHGGCDVIKGHKFAANKWFYNRVAPSRLRGQQYGNNHVDL